MLDYAGIPASPGDGPIVEVLPDGVVLEVGFPSAVKEIVSALSFTAMAMGFAAGGVLLVRETFRSPWAFGTLLRTLFFLVMAPLWGFGAAGQWGRVGRVMRGDRKLCKLLLSAADQEWSMDHDPVKVIRAQEGKVEFNLRRPAELYVKTESGDEHRLFRGRPLEELRQLEDRLKSLLRLDEPPVRGFPVMPIKAEAGS